MNQIASPKQKMLLQIIKNQYGGDLAHTRENLAALRDMMGWRSLTSVHDCLRALRSKGYLVSLGPMTQPYRWAVSTDDI